MLMLSVYTIRRAIRLPLIDAAMPPLPMLMIRCRASFATTPPCFFATPLFLDDAAAAAACFRRRCLS